MRDVLSLLAAHGYETALVETVGVGQEEMDVVRIADVTAVVVTPEDNAKVPVHGTLVAASEHEVIIHRRDAKAGNLHLHFPRLGYEVLPA